MKFLKNPFFLLLFLGVLLATKSYGQENLSKEDVIKYTKMVNLAEGTYQIQAIDTRKFPAIPLSLIQRIEDKRDETKIIYFNFKPNIRVKILPKQVITKKGFVSIDRMKIISSNEL